MWSGEKRQNQGKGTLKKRMVSNISFKLLVNVFVIPVWQEAQKLAVIRNDETVFPSVPLPSSPFLSLTFLPPSLPFAISCRISAICSVFKLPPAFAHNWFVKANLRNTFFIASVQFCPAPFDLSLSLYSFFLPVF